MVIDAVYSDVVRRIKGLSLDAQLFQQGQGLVKALIDRELDGIGALSHPALLALTERGVIIVFHLGEVVADVQIDQRLARLIGLFCGGIEDVLPAPLPADVRSGNR